MGGGASKEKKQSKVTIVKADDKQNQEEYSKIKEKQKKTVKQGDYEKKTKCCGLIKTKKPTQKSRVDKVRQTYKTHKSTILVKQKVGKTNEQFFEGRQKKILDVKMRRQQPYEVLKQSDYFDSQEGDKSDLYKIKKVHEDCEVANYQTPQVEKLQTVQVKTYVFDRNMVKIE